MKLDRFKELLGPDLTYACMDVSRGEEGGNKEIHSRWNNLSNRLSQAGVPEETIDAMGELMLTPTRIGGPHGRYLAFKDGVAVFDQILPQPPGEDIAGFGAPSLEPILHSFASSVRYLMIVADRTGIDVTWSTEEEPDLEAAVFTQIDAEHDEIRKVSVGGWSQRRYQARAEDSWERNSESAAATINDWVLKLKPELVLLGGEIRTVALIKKNLNQDTLSILKDLDGASRAEGVNMSAFEEKLASLLEEFKLEREESKLEGLREALGRRRGAAEGVGETMEALSKGQVSDLFVAEGQIKVGPQEDPRELLEALMVASLETDAEVHVITTDTELRDGIAANLRWDD